MTDKKKRGRKPISEGGKSSPRKIYCTCAAIVDGELVHKKVWCENGTKDTKDEDLLAEAAGIFETEHGVEPSVEGPFFPRVGVSVNTKKRENVNIPMEELMFKPGNTGTAVYKDWNVNTRFIENREDAVFIMFKTHTKKDAKSKPSNRVVLIEALSDFVADASA